MGIGDIFRPKHRHSDAVIRAEAVRALGPDEVEVAIEVARADDEPSIRKLAIEKIDEPTVLFDLASADRSADVSAHARQRAVALLVTQAIAGGDLAAVRSIADRLVRAGEERALVDIAVRAGDGPAARVVVDKITQARALGELVRQTGSEELRLYALDRLDDAEVLRSIAIDEERKSVALAALNRIADREILEAIATRGKNKAVRARANKMLTAMAQDDRAIGSGQVSVAKLRHAERVQLCGLVEKLASARELVESYQQVTGAEARWEALGNDAEPELASRFARACERYFETYDRMAKQAQLQAAEREAREKAEREKAEREAREKAERAAAKAAATAAAAVRAEAPAPPVVAGPVEGPAVETAPAPTEPAAPVVDAEAEEDAVRGRHLAALEQLSERLEQLAAADKLKHAEKKLAQIEASHRDIGPLPGKQRRAATERYEEARRKAVIKIAELREAEEWKRWANVPKQEQLIAKVKAMIEAEPSEKLAAELHQAQIDWREVGPAPRDKSQEYWNQFKAACDAVYERIKGFRAHASEEKKDNLKKKEELCARAEELADSTDWEGTALELKRLQSEWKAVGPVPRRQSDAIWKRFRTACDKFFERRKPFLDQAMAERNKHVAEKQAVVERAEALLAELGAAGADADWDAAFEEVAELRQAWRRTGPVPQRAFAELSQRFKDAADAIHRLRDELRHAAKAAERAEIEAILTALHEFLAAAEPDGPAIAEGTMQLRNAIKRIAGDNSQSARDLRQQMETTCREALERHPDAFRGTDLDPEQNRKRKEKLCARIEELIPADKPAMAAPTTAEEMAARLRAALADRALGGVLARQTEKSVEDIIREARESWARLGPVPGPAGAELEQRFEQACQRARG